MSYIDLQAVLNEWSYDPEQISVRKILGVDGTVKIQMRVELGVLQMEGQGRPDGVRPHGHESLLAYHRKRLAKYEERNGTALGFALSPQECHALQTESSLYYRRFVALFVLEEYDGVAEDTAHSLGVFDLCRDYALEPEDRTCMEPYRAYVLMMDARARAHHAISEGQPASALAHINRGIMNLKAYFEQAEDVDTSDETAERDEIRLLRNLAKEVLKHMPEDSVIVTRRALRAAIEEERFEEAAKLRDALRDLEHLEN
jgi:hypothetical protein